MANDLRGVLRTAHDWTARFLESNLPTVCGAEWWKTCVCWKLSVPQERALEERDIANLQGLDLAALLRVVDKNWRELCLALRLPREGRTLVNEVRNIRNRLAHEPLSGLPLEDQQRDADTLARYLDLIGAEEAAVMSAKQLKEALLRRLMMGESPADGEEMTGQDSRETESEPVEAAEPELLSREDETEGVPTECVGPRAAAVQGVRDAMRRATYVGIDFGTSTTVVSVVTADGNTERLLAEPISITQLSETGRETDDHLVPSCIAWTRNRLLVGRGAADLRPELIEGKNVWSSFKMRLGVDLGPQYPNTVLSHEAGGVVIERPQDAARVFFEFIREAVEDYVQSKGLPARVYYAVSVPAAFEANQRQDLINALADAGIPVEESSLIDEPNAAFLSYLVEMESNTSGSRFLDSMAQRARRVLVFDFGAGTCDISVLEVKVKNDRLLSRNLAISKFMALGGDDLDRAIAREVLLPQLCGGKAPTSAFSTNEIETVVLPRLKPQAELLKIQCSKMAEDGGFRTLDDLRRQKAVVRGNPIPAVSLRGNKWELKDPRISLSEFADMMAPFLADPSFDDEEVRDQTPSVLEPIASALEKAGLSYDELDMVLFIGGSSENPLVRQRIADHLGRFVDCVTPRDLRAHVSQGAAVHSLFVHGLGWDLIRPITSEPIYVITRNNNLDLILPAGTSVPSPDISVTELRVDQDRQERVELPICVSGANKILAVVSAMPPTTPGYFKKGERVRLSCSITGDKLLKVRVRIGDKSLTARILNPLANAALTDKDRRLLEARQALNEAILSGNGRPTPAAVLNFALAAQTAKRWREAAEMFEAVERLDPKRDFATEITYSYAMAGDRENDGKWSEKAYERAPSSVTAYNLAITKSEKGDMAGYERLMEESLKHDPDGDAALNAYGHYLAQKGNPRGLELVEKACDLLSDELAAGILSESDYGRLRQAATTLGRAQVLRDLKEYQKSKGADDALIREEYLVAGSTKGSLRIVE